MGRGDDPDVGADRRAAADRRVFALLQDAQKAGLRLHRHIADLVEEERAAFRLLETALRAGLRAGESALLVPEQLGFDEIARDRRHVQRHERRIAPLAIVMQSLGQELLARPGLAHDHDGQIRLRHARNDTIDVLHGGRAANQRQRLALPFGACDLRAALGFRQGPPDDRDQLLQIERLGQIFVGAFLGRRDGRHQRILGAHDDNRQVRPQLLDARNEIEGVLVGHDDVGDDQIALALARPAPQRRGIARRLRRIARPRQCLIEHGPDGCIVIRDEDIAGHHVRAPVQDCRLAGSRGRRSSSGRRTRKTVRFGVDSHSIMPP